MDKLYAQLSLLEFLTISISTLGIIVAKEYFYFVIPKKEIFFL